MKFSTATRCCIALAALPLLALAQQPPRADPADPGARVPHAVYVSPFVDYQRLGEQAVNPWRASNDAVERAGGWKAYAREAQQPAPGKPSAPPVKPASHDGHAGHGKH